jgi:hypothetical protein
LFALVSGYEVGRPRRTQHSLMNVCFMEDFAQRVLAIQFYYQLLSGIKF